MRVEEWGEAGRKREETSDFTGSIGVIAAYNKY